MDRMAILHELFETDHSLIDIGSDHGYLGISLLRAGKTTQVFNIDKSKHSLNCSIQHYSKYNLLRGASFIYGDGFQPWEINVTENIIHAAINTDQIFANWKNIKHTTYPSKSVVVIAGLGSSQILKILNAMPDHLTTVIVMSQTNSFLIRDWTEQHHWTIHNEKYVCSGKKVYLAIKMKKGGTNNFSFEEKLLGYQKFWPLQSDLLKLFWEGEFKRMNSIKEEYWNYFQKKMMVELKNRLFIK